MVPAPAPAPPHLPSPQLLPTQLLCLPTGISCQPNHPLQAFFKQQRLPGAAAMRRALQRPCKQQAAPAAEDEAVGSAARARAATPLQTALSIQPIPEGDSLDSMLVSLPPLPSLGRHSRPAPGRMSLPLGVQLWGAQSGSAAGSRAPSDTLEAVLAELAAVQQNTAQQAAMLAEGRACASSMQQQVALVQGAWRWGQVLWA